MCKDDIIALYLRISVEDIDVKRGVKDESNSIEGQRNLLHDFVIRKPEFEHSTVLELCDDGYSGTNFDRPAMKRLLEMAKQKEVACIIVKDLSRFGRDYLTVSDYVDQIFPFLGIRFISVNDGYDSAEYSGVTSGIDIAFRNMAYAYYSKDISEKVRSGKKAKAQKGAFLSSFAPFGYQKDSADKNYLIVEEVSAAIVRRIFHLAASGMRTTKIAYLLNLEQVPTPSVVKNQQGLQHPWWKGHREEKLWDYNQVTRILHDERYLGKVIYGKEYRPEVGNYKTIKRGKKNWIIVADCHEPLVSQEEFQAAQAVLREYEECDRKARTGYIFANKLRCGICERPLYRKRKTNIEYQCIIKYQTPKFACKDNVIRESDLIGVVWLAILNYCQILLGRQKYSAKGNNTEKAIDLQKQLAAYQVTLGNLDEQKAVLYEQMVDGKFDREQYIREREELSARQAGIQQEMEELEEKLRQIRQMDHDAIPKTETLLQYLQEETLTREMVDAFVKCIYVYDAQSVHIEWMFDEGGGFDE